MWLLQPAKGRTAIRNLWRDLLRSIPDYRLDVLHIATEPATNDAFVMWRASGMARLPLVPQRPITNKPFEHCGVTRWAQRTHGGGGGRHLPRRAPAETGLQR